MEEETEDPSGIRSQALTLLMILKTGFDQEEDCFVIF